VAIAGFGGLGQMGVKLAKALGNEVSVISSSMHKKDKALKLGATHFIHSQDPEQLQTFGK